MPMYETRPKFIKVRLEKMTTAVLISTLKNSRKDGNYWGFDFTHKYLVKEIESRLNGVKTI